MDWCRSLNLPSVEGIFLEITSELMPNFVNIRPYPNATSRVRVWMLRLRVGLDLVRVGLDLGLG